MLSTPGSGDGAPGLAQGKQRARPQHQDHVHDALMEPYHVDVGALHHPKCDRGLRKGHLYIGQA